MAHSQPRAWASGAIDIHRKAWQSLGLRWQACQATEGDRKSEWSQTIGARARDTLAVNQHINRPGAVKTVLVGVDISQSITRASTTVRLNNFIVSPTILPGSLLWLSFEREFGGEVEHVHWPLAGAEALLLQGWPIFNPKWATLLQGTPERLCQSLAGNAFSGTVIMALVSSLLFGVDGAVKPDIEHDDEVDNSSATVGKDSAASVLKCFQLTSCRKTEGET